LINRRIGDLIDGYSHVTTSSVAEISQKKGHLRQNCHRTQFVFSGRRYDNCSIIEQ
jgi:hypothetical protein